MMMTQTLVKQKCNMYSWQQDRTSGAGTLTY